VLGLVPVGTAVSADAAPSVEARHVAVAPCRGSQLIGNFSLVRDSEGAGNVTYALELINRSRSTCSVTGLPEMQLLAVSGRLLPTHVSLARIGRLAPLLLVLAHGDVAWASARFSPDVPGVGERTLGPCEATASRVRVSSRSPDSAVVLPVRPPTPVCEHGSMSVSVLGRVRPTS